MGGVTHILSPVSATWVGWTMLALLLSGILSEFCQHGLITRAHYSLIVQSDRTYKDAPINLWGQILITIFRFGVLGLAVYFCFSGDRPFLFITYLAICGVSVGVLIAKMVCTAIVDYTFMLSQHFGSPYEHYSNIGTLTSVLLFLLLPVLQRLEGSVGILLIGAVAVLYAVMWIYRSAGMFIKSPLSILYFILYFLTLEVLPLGLLLFLADKTIQSI